MGMGSGGISGMIGQEMVARILSWGWARGHKWHDRPGDGCSDIVMGMGSGHKWHDRQRRGGCSDIVMGMGFNLNSLD